MQVRTLILVAMTAVISGATVVQRQKSCPEAEGLPACGPKCLAEIAPDIGCNPRDYDCVCGDFERLQDAGTACALRECDSPQEVLKLLAMAQEICEKCT
ncbi:hypothetical protein VTJ49DRAFT_3424 [Mycothermus thermophilus]|uniref:CFEM domain-containing protein n=1 Tax=Humicola insolens TaxID=85995 RepID=A0ABR3V7Z5_HUMIN